VKLKYYFDTKAKDPGLDFWVIEKEGIYYILSSDSVNPSIFQRASKYDQERLKKANSLLLKRVSKKKFNYWLTSEFHGSEIYFEEKERNHNSELEE